MRVVHGLKPQAFGDLPKAKPAAGRLPAGKLRRLGSRSARSGDTAESMSNSARTCNQVGKTVIRIRQADTWFVNKLCTDLPTACAVFARAFRPPV